MNSGAFTILCKAPLYNLDLARHGTPFQIHQILTRCYRDLIFSSIWTVTSSAELSGIGQESRRFPPLNIRSQERIPSIIHISLWFTTEREERDFWISQRSLPSPPASRRFLNQSFNQALTSKSKSQQAPPGVAHTDNSLEDDVMLGMLSQATVEPQSMEACSSSLSPTLQREQDSPRVLDIASHSLKRARKQYRSRRPNENRPDQNTRVFGCPTCPSNRSPSKNMDEWYRHQRGCHFPPHVWICSSAGQKSCNTPPAKRQDNFRTHLKNKHGFKDGKGLDSEVTKRGIKITEFSMTSADFVNEIFLAGM